MPKYTLFYRGGAPKDAAEGASMQPRWDDWFRSLGEHLCDRGAPARSLGFATPEGRLATSEPTTGYSVISVASEEEAMGIALSCPIYGDGGVVEIARYVEPSRL